MNSRRRFPSIPKKLLLLLVYLPAIASARDSSSDDAAIIESFLDIPVVVSASRLPQPVLMTPSSITVIDRILIELSGARQIPELFRLVPGFPVAEVSGGSFSVSYHGQEISLPSRLEVMIDGRSVYSNILSTVNWNAIGITLQDIEKIEVIRGSNAHTYGSNSFITTINIQTRQPYGEHLNSAHATKTSEGEYGVQLAHSGSAGKLDYRISGSFSQDDGYEHRGEDEAEYEAHNKQQIRYAANLHLDSGAILEMQLDAVEIDGGTYLPGLTENYIDHSGKTSSNSQNLRWTIPDADSGTHQIQFYHNYLNQTDRADALVSDMFGVAPEALPLFTGGIPDQLVTIGYADGISETYDLEYQRTLTTAGKTRIAAGAGFRHNSFESPLHLKRNQVDSDNWRLFTSVESPLTTASSLHIGAMLESNEHYDSYGSLKLALNHRLTPTTSLRASINSAQRAPSLLETYWNFRPQLEQGPYKTALIYSPDDLENEKLLSANLGLRWISADKQHDLDLAVFHEDANDILTRGIDPLDLDLLVTTLKVSNHVNYEITGIEGQYRWRPSSHRFLAASFLINESKRVILWDYFRAPTVYNNATASNMLSLSYGAKTDSGWCYSLNAYHMGETTWLGEGNQLPAYQRYDVSVGKDLYLGNSELKVSLHGKDIFADRYEFHSSNKVKPEYYLSLGVNF